jgi:hypothetical protein
MGKTWAGTMGRHSPDGLPGIRKKPRLRSRCGRDKLGHADEQLTQSVDSREQAVEGVASSAAILMILPSEHEPFDLLGHRTVLVDLVARPP